MGRTNKKNQRQNQRTTKKGEHRHAPREETEEMQLRKTDFPEQPKTNTKWGKRWGRGYHIRYDEYGQIKTFYLKVGIGKKEVCKWCNKWTTHEKKVRRCKDQEEDKKHGEKQ